VTTPEKEGTEFLPISYFNMLVAHDRAISPIVMSCVTLCLSPSTQSLFNDPIGPIPTVSVRMNDAESPFLPDNLEVPVAH
jgi:hypothetical protein